MLKNAFSWDESAVEAFNKLKTTMIEALVLALPNFSQPFVIECDASGMGIGTVLMQSSRPIAFLSKALRGKVVHMSTYEKELFTLVIIFAWKTIHCQNKPSKSKVSFKTEGGHPF